MRILSAFIPLLLNLFVSAQTTRIDSLKKNIEGRANDTNKINTLLYLGKELRNTGNYDTAVQYISAAENIALALQNSPNEIIRTAATRDLGKAYNSKGIIYWYRGNYPLALKNYYSALQINEKLGYKKGIAAAYNNLGLVYTDQKNYPLAIKNYDVSLKLYQELNDKKGIAASYNNLGNIYKNKGDFEPALKNHFEALKLRLETGDKMGVATSYNNIGLICWMRGKYEEALKNHFESFKLKKEVGDKQGLAGSYNNIGMVYLAMKKPAEAKKFLVQGLALSHEVGSVDYTKESYLGLSRLDSMTGNWKESFNFYKLYITLRDSMLNEENTKASVRLEMNYEFDKKEAATKMEQEKKEAVAAAERKKQRMVLILICCVLVLVGFFAIFAYRSYLQKQKANEAITGQKSVIEEKQKEILDSIRYALRIQTALIPSEKFIEKIITRLKS
ncbi:MAG TPA: tetratricopeptide repeat protein [Bacteroidia bacterium]|jgi:tetratricopeptide (TPR) repeat protein|nr:tetratricopeptide repeat protein [Bacteroidia bacterium]